MAYPMSATTIEQALADVAELYLGVGEVMAKRGPKNGVADEGGYWPDVKDTAAAGAREVDSVLVKVNQTGTVSGGARAVAAARQADLSVIVSARSGGN